MIDLYENLSKEEADLCALVLNSASIPHRVKYQGNGWSIRVEERHYAMARHVMTQYFTENRMEQLEKSESPVQEHGHAGIWIALLLAVCYWAVSRAESVREIWSDLGASAIRINDGELYRIVTALFLHADPVHLVGNMAGMAIFGTAVCQVAGWGTGSLLILLSGAFGNLVNAWMYESGHLSIGASTAVFGAIGILSGYQFREKRRIGRRWAARWLPIAGGVALLGLLGSGEHVDLAAHLFGFVVGIAIGMVYVSHANRLGTERFQWICVVAAIGIILASGARGYLSM